MSPRKYSSMSDKSATSPIYTQNQPQSTTEDKNTPKRRNSNGSASSVIGNNNNNNGPLDNVGSPVSVHDQNFNASQSAAQSVADNNVGTVGTGGTLRGLEGGGGSRGDEYEVEMGQLPDKIDEGIEPPHGRVLPA
jgi:hypothetical protein